MYVNNFLHLMKKKIIIKIWLTINTVTHMLTCYAKKPSFAGVIFHIALPNIIQNARKIAKLKKKTLFFTF